MNFTHWLKAEMPHLENESSAVIFRYIKQAKEATFRERLLISLINFIVCVIAGFGIGFAYGYVFAKYTEVESTSTTGVLISVAFFIFMKIRVEERIKDRVIQKELLKIAQQSALQT